VRTWLRIDVALAALAFLVHAGFANRYDFFRDELYFIICGRHPAFGYVDQPPLVPLISALTQAAGENLVLLRLVPALAAGATVFVACAIARLAGGGRFAQVAAGIPTGLAPMFLGLYATFNTTVFEPLAWTLVVYLAARAIVKGDHAAVLWLGLVAGVALEVKYSILFYLGALVVALLLLPERRLLRLPQAGIAAAMALALAAPSLVWQAMHGWPFAELLAAAPGKNVAVAPVPFVLNQIAVMNPLFAPVWIAGVVSGFVDRRLTAFRVFGLAFLVVFAEIIALHGKDYYLAAAYPPMFALGSVVVEGVVRQRALRAVYVGLAAAVSVLAAPFSMPILDPPATVRYMTRLHITLQGRENNLAARTMTVQGRADRNTAAALPQIFSDQLGWRTYEQQIAGVYHALGSEQRDRVPIITSNYGEAAALDFYGGRDELPPALSGHNEYFLWGTHGYDGSVVLFVNGNITLYRSACREATVVGTFGSTYAMPYERNAPIILCLGLRRPLPQVWPKFKHYD